MLRTSAAKADHVDTILGPSVTRTLPGCGFGKTLMLGRKAGETPASPEFALVREIRGESYSATASFSITTFRCAVTSLCSFTGTVNSPSVFSGSWI